jgi:hypothetical protein
MKTTNILLLATLLLALACKDGKTYVEMLEDEKNAISQYIADNGYEILHAFPADTVFQPHQFFLAENGLYLNIVARGVPVVYRDTEKITMRVLRFHLFSVTGEAAFTPATDNAFVASYLYNFPTAYMEGSNGAYEIISEGSVYPLLKGYVGYEGIARMIIPSKISNSYCKSQVWPVLIEIKYTGENLPE